MQIIEITGDDLRTFFWEVGVDNAIAESIRIVRVSVEEGTAKFKVNEGGWSRPLGKPMYRRH